MTDRQPTPTVAVVDQGKGFDPRQSESRPGGRSSPGTSASDGPGAGLGALLAEFDAYLARTGAEPFADLVGYRQGVLWLSDEEVADAAGEIQAVLAARAGNRAARGRRSRLLGLIQFPAEAPPSGKPA